MSQFLKQYSGKIILITAIIVGIVVFFALDLQKYLTLEYLQSSRSEFIAYYESSPVLTLGSYMLIYIIVTALSLPGAVVLTLAGGALFGFWVGTIVVSFASTIGATCAMIVARMLLRDYVQSRFNEQIKVINEGIEKDGGYYLFTMRLVPAIPFFAINLAMALTPMRAITFAWVSQVGMLAGTMVYINAGAELGQIQSLKDILSMELILSFALLGIFPLLVKKTLSFVEKKRAVQKSV